MAKPICVMYYNPEIIFNSGKKPSVSEMNKEIENRLPDYHTFALPSHQSMDGSCEDIRFEVFNAENMDSTSLEQFKEEMLKAILVS